MSEAADTPVLAAARALVRSCGHAAPTDPVSVDTVAAVTRLRTELAEADAATARALAAALPVPR